MELSPDNNHFENNVQFIALDDRANVIANFCDQVSRNMDATGLQLPPAWTSVRELAEHVWHVNDEELVTIPYVIHLTNELALPLINLK
ncbi:hypothetical protein KY285_005852 [Solanum tuberosum]|nr:hypothetical protein KY289_006305 [Solanum tuberosum]KAH0752704.1 hypothetical protein KY285_005852 [Solanum tuberosum]